MITAGLCWFGALLLARPRSPTWSARGLVWPAALAAIGAIHTPDPPSATGWTLDNLQVHDIGNGTTDGAGAELGVGWHVVGGRYFNTRQEGLTAGDGAANFVGVPASQEGDVATEDEQRRQGMD